MDYTPAIDLPKRRQRIPSSKVAFRYPRTLVKQGNVKERRNHIPCPPQQREILTSHARPEKGTLSVPGGSHALSHELSFSQNPCLKSKGILPGEVTSERIHWCYVSTMEVQITTNGTSTCNLGTERIPVDPNTSTNGIRRRKTAEERRKQSTRDNAELTERKARKTTRTHDTTTRDERRWEERENGL